MKKTIKRIALTITILLALIGTTGTVAFAAGYITWGGTQDFEKTLTNLNLISERGKTLKTEIQTLETKNGTINSELEQTRNQLHDKDNQLLDKDNQIDNLNQQIEALEKRIKGGQTSQDQLKQAEKDMRDVKNKSEQVLNEFN